MTPPPSKIKYINNRELLAEIHKSKKTFCSFIDKEHADFDVIVDSIKDINTELAEKTRQKKANPRGKPSVDPETIPLESIVFRVMTFEHIPLDPHRTRKSRLTDESYAKTSFPPFKHYILTKEGEVQEVCRSHWQGGFQNGHFCADHGAISNRLAMMFMMLVDRYSRRANWRGYTYVDEMRSTALVQLSQIGLQFNEAKSDNPFAFYTTAIRNCFVRTLNLEKRSQNIRDDLLIIAGASPSYTRQIEHELESKFPPSEIKSTPKRGAPKKNAKKVPEPVE